MLYAAIGAILWVAFLVYLSYLSRRRLQNLLQSIWLSEHQSEQNTNMLTLDELKYWQNEISNERIGVE